MPAGITRRFTLTSPRSIRSHFGCRSERSEESQIIFGLIEIDKSEMFRFAQHDSAV